jgi:hypothetical protein
MRTVAFDASSTAISRRRPLQRDGVPVAANDGVDDAFLVIRRLIGIVGLVERPHPVGFVFGEQEIDGAFAVEVSLAQETMAGRDGARIGASSKNLQVRLVVAPAAP